MFNRIIHFIKYNNLTVLIVLAIFVAGGGAFAATETGRELIGAEGTRIEGIDNTLLLAVDLDSLDMDYKIERIEGDADYYYVTYTFLDIDEKNGAWEYMMKEKTRKVSKKIDARNIDLGEYLAGELAEEYEARVSDLKAEKAKAEAAGESTRTEVTEYSGLIGRTLALAGKIFPGYEPVKTRIVPSPETALPSALLRTEASGDPSHGEGTSPADSLTDIYDDYIAENDPDRDDVFGILDNCPDTANPGQADGDGDGVGDACAGSPAPEPAALSGEEEGPGAEDGTESAPAPGTEDGTGAATAPEEIAESEETTGGETPAEGGEEISLGGEEGIGEGTAEDGSAAGEPETNAEGNAAGPDIEPDVEIVELPE